MSLSFERGLAIIFQGDQKGVIDSSGEVIIPLTKCGIAILENGLIELRTEGKEFTGQNYIENYHEAGVIGGLYSLYNRFGKKISPKDYGFIDEFSNGVAVVNLGGIYSFTCFDFGAGFSEELEGGKFGLLHENGAEITEPKYDFLKKVDANLYLAKMESENFLLNSNGENITANSHDLNKIIEVNYSLFDKFY